MKKDILIITRRTEDSVIRGQKLARTFGYDWGDNITMHLNDFHLDSSKDAIVLCLDNEKGVITYCEYEYFFDISNRDKLFSQWENFTIVDIRSRNVMETE